MKILFDHQIFSFQNYGGASRYFYELTDNLKSQDIDVDNNLKFSNNVYAKGVAQNIKPFIPQLNYPFKNINLFYINRVFGDGKIRSKQFDIFHPTYYHPYFLELVGNKPYVVTVLDMIHEKFKDDYKELNSPTIKFKKKVVENASAVIAISDTTKKDVLDYYKLDPNKVHVTHLSSSLSGLKSIKPKSFPLSNYLLYVGSRGGYKNFRFFITSIADLLKREKLNLVCVGGGEFNKEEIVLINKLKLSALIFYQKFHSDSELVYYYKNALAHVISSLYEGFGLTALEAFDCQCPVVLSNTSSLPEVAGDAATYFDPTNSESIIVAVDKVIRDSKYRKQLVTRGVQRKKKFTWEKTAKETIKIYSKLI